MEIFFSSTTRPLYKLSQNRKMLRIDISVLGHLECATLRGKAAKQAKENKETICVTHVSRKIAAGLPLQNMPYLFSFLIVSCIDGDA